MAENMDDITTEKTAATKHSNRWRVVDIVVAAIIAVASGVIFWGWDVVCEVPLNAFRALTPGFEGLLNGFWLFAAPLAAIIVRKPGAALFAETLAAFLELTLGNQWGVGGSLLIGIMQGLGAEIAFAIFMYRKWNIPVTMLAGSLAGVACAIYYWLTNPAWGPLQVSIYFITSIISGAVFAVVCCLLQRALAATGVLDRFESGRARELVCGRARRSAACPMERTVGHAVPFRYAMLAVRDAAS